MFSVENNKEDGTIPSLDTTVKPEVDGKLSITVYTKPTHTYQYLQWDSHHHLSAKCGAINTPTHRAKTICSEGQKQSVIILSYSKRNGASQEITHSLEKTLPSLRVR